MNVLHLCHGFQPGNGFESYFVSLLNSDTENINTVVLPAGKYNDIGLSPAIDIIEILSFSELNDIVKKYQADILLIHWTGAEGLKSKECGLILQNGRHYFDLMPGVMRTLDNDPYGYLYSARLVKKKIPIVIIAHSEFEIPLHVQKPEITALVAVSNKALNPFKRNNFDKYVIPNGIDTERFNKRDSSRLSDRITIAWSGRLSKYDNNIYNAIVSDPDFDNCLFVYFGSGLIEPDPPSNHLFLGSVKDIDKWLNKTDIFLYPSLIDSFGLAIVEAMACKLPVIGSVEVQEVVGNSGFTYTTVNNCIAILKDLIMSKYTREVFGKQARQRVLENYSITKMVEGYNNLYRELING
jgi:glycosyltransferase involved in cell wall biosynthesis